MYPRVFCINLSSHLLEQVPFRRHLSRQLSIAFDLYLQIREKVAHRVDIALKRDSPDWRLKHACPACTYKLKDEEPLNFSMLLTCDGNDSLRRVLKRKATDEEAETLGASSELRSIHGPHMDTRMWGGRYLSRSYVDAWAKNVVQEMMVESLDTVSNAKPCKLYQLPNHTYQNDPDYNPCVERWKNMSDDITRRAWAIFDETGLFLALCRHGFALLLADMVQSGELYVFCYVTCLHATKCMHYRAKYPLAIVQKLLDTFGKDLGLGYDIGCKFKTTVRQSSLGAQARELNLTCLVGAFHGHAHNRICQLSHLATYVDGLGLEDLEGCERAFSKSNALAAAIRHASIFHRMQAIATYFEHTDKFEVYANLSESSLHYNMLDIDLSTLQAISFSTITNRP